MQRRETDAVPRLGEGPSARVGGTEVLVGSELPGEPCWVRRPGWSPGSSAAQWWPATLQDGEMAAKRNLGKAEVPSL